MSTGYIWCPVCQEYYAVFGETSEVHQKTKDRERLEWLIYHCLQNDASPISISRGRELLGFEDMNQMRDWLKVYRDSDLYNTSNEKGEANG
jgi:uncharacterized Zn finger protein (UPF0148 family)